MTKPSRWRVILRQKLLEFNLGYLHRHLMSKTHRQRKHPHKLPDQIVKERTDKIHRHSRVIITKYQCPSTGQVTWLCQKTHNYVAFRVGRRALYAPRGAGQQVFSVNYKTVNYPNSGDKSLAYRACLGMAGTSKRPLIRGYCDLGKPPFTHLKDMGTSCGNCQSFVLNPFPIDPYRPLLDHT